MRKSFTILIALVLAFFTVPFSGITAFAADKPYDKIEDGQYELEIKLLKKDTDEESAAAAFMKNNASLVIEGDSTALIFYIPENPAMNFNKFEVEGIEPIIGETTEVDEETGEEITLATYTFELKELRSKLHSSVSYEVPMLGLIHNDVEMDIAVLGLDQLPVKDERVVGDHVDENDADLVYRVDFDSDSSATKGQLNNPVTVLIKDEKAFLQISVSDRGAPLFRSLKFNGEEVLWNSITEAPFVIQHELENGMDSLADEIDVSMVIQAGPNVMPHDGIKLWFDEDSLEEVDKDDENSEGEDPEAAKEERVLGDHLKKEEADEVFEVDYKTDSKATSAQLLNPVTVLVKDGKAFIQIGISEGGAQFFRSLKFNGEEVVWNSITEGPFVIQYELANGLDSLEEEIEVSMVIQAGPNVMPHDNIKLWFELDSSGEGSDEEEDPKEEEKDKDETPGSEEETELTTLTPDKVYEVAYEILQEDGSGPSVADGFFVKPGHILEKDGVKYIQIKVTDGEYVKALSNEFGDAIIVKENEDGSVILQLKLKDDLSDMILDMHIVVGAGAMPGFPGYDAKHKAILSIDSTSLEAIDTADHLLAGTGDEKNENGPFLKDQPKPDPEKPELDDETDEEETVETDETPKKDDDEKNPQTGVKTNFLLYTFLLISSLIPLVLQLRRRFV